MDKGWKIKDTRIKKSENDLEKTAKEKMLDFCKETGNDIQFIEDGKNLNLEKLEIKIEILNKIGVDQIDFLKTLLHDAKKYLNGPLFSDSLNSASDRQKWKNDNLEKMKNEKGEEVLKYYKSNRLRLQNISCGFDVRLGVFFEKIEDIQRQEKLANIKIYEYKSQGGGEEIKREKRIKIARGLSEILEEFILLVEKKG